MPPDILEQLLTQDLGSLHMELAKARAVIALRDAEIEKLKALAGGASSLVGGDPARGKTKGK